MARPLLFVLLLILALVGAWWWQASASALSEQEARELLEWLTCDECTDDELSRVTVTLGERALPLLGRTLLADTLAFMADARAAIADAWAAHPPPGTDQVQYVDFFAANLEAQVRKRSAVALGILGDTLTLRQAAEQAVALGLRADVVTAIQQARRAAGAPGMPPLVAERVLVRPTSVTLTIGDTSSLEALGRAADSSRVAGPVSWASSDPAVASVASPSPGHARVAGVSAGVATLTATLGSASGTATVTVLPPLPGPTLTLAAILGDAQVASAGGSPAQSLVVWLHASGTHVPGATVTWTTTGPGFGPVSASTTTDAVGRASHTPVLGTTPGVYWVVAQAGTRTARFQLRVIP